MERPQNHHESHSRLYSYAIHLYKQRKYEQALEAFKRDLEFKVRVYGRNHVKTALTIGAIGSLYHELQQVREAVLKYNEALAILRNFGELKNVIYCQILSKLAQALHALGKYEEALVAYTLVAKAHQERILVDDASFGSVLNKKAMVLESLGRLSESRQCYEQSIALQTKVHGENAQCVMETKSNLDAMVQIMGAMGAMFVVK